MFGYLIRRLGTAILIVLCVSMVTFAMLHIIFPSPAIVVLGAKPSHAATEAFNKQWGYNLPLWHQYIRYLDQLLHGNFGWSFHSNQSVGSLFKERFPLSAFLSFSSLLVAVIIALPLGIFQAIKRNSVGDVAATTVTFVLYSMPVFFFAVILIDVFALQLGWVDSGVNADQGSLSAQLADFKDLILPIVSLSLTQVASFSRYQRSAALDVLSQDYIKVARAKGLAERLIYVRHLVRNASLPMVTLIGLSIPSLIAGNLLIEYAFNINGLGNLFIQSLGFEDYNTLLAYTLLGAIATVIGNLVADIALTIADPRIRLV